MPASSTASAKAASASVVERVSQGHGGRHQGHVHAACCARQARRRSDSQGPHGCWKHSEPFPSRRGECSTERKYDGFRCLAFRYGDKIGPQSKKQNSLNRFRIEQRARPCRGWVPEPDPFLSRTRHVRRRGSGSRAPQLFQGEQPKRLCKPRTFSKATAGSSGGETNRCPRATLSGRSGGTRQGYRSGSAPSMEWQNKGETAGTLAAGYCRAPAAATV